MEKKNKAYIDFNGEKIELKEIDIKIDTSNIIGGVGESFSRYQILGKQGIAMIGDATISPEFVGWLEEGRKKQDHKNRLERLCYNKITCETEGHDWSYYEVSIGYWGNDIEQAGVCKRCGFDTHAHSKES